MTERERVQWAQEAALHHFKQQVDTNQDPEPRERRTPLGPLIIEILQNTTKYYEMLQNATKYETSTVSFVESSHNNR